MESIWGLGFGDQINGNSITGFKGKSGIAGSTGIRRSRPSDTLVEGNYIQSASPSAMLGLSTGNAFFEVSSLRGRRGSTTFF